MLALLLLLHIVAGKEVQNDVLTAQNITSCPDTGYFFKHDVIPNAIDPGPCKLCFCQDNTTSVCWLRDSKKCDPKGYTFAVRKKRADRSRRSPGFSDIFFRDAAREVFNRQTPQQCEPFESSISEGCPPADWCIGCTVCDCDANGRWDCHNLSFCPDKKGKKQYRKKKNNQRSRIVKRQLAKKKSTPKTTKRPNKKPTKKFTNKPITGKKSQNNKYKPKQNKKQIKKIGNTKKITPVRKSKKTYNKKKVPPKIKKSNKSIKKGTKSIKLNSKKGPTKKGRPLDQNETIQYTKKILKRVMASVNKIVNESKNNVKRSMAKQINKKNKQNKSKGVKKFKTWQPIIKVPSNKKQKTSRLKRQISKDSSDHFEKENITNFLPKIENIVFSPSRKYIKDTLKNEGSLSLNRNKYFVYNVDSKHENNTKEKNHSEKKYTTTQMLSRSNDLKTVHENNITVTEATVFVSGYDRTTSTSVIVHISDLVNTTLFKKTLNNTSYKKKKRCGPICQLKKASNMLIGDFDRRTVRKKKENANNKNLMAYFRSVFRSLLQANKKKAAPVIKKPVYRKRNIIKNLCKDIYPCNFDPFDKTLQFKLNQLRMESNKILKSVSIIRGLLKLFGRELSVIKNISSIDNSKNNKDILILNAILKDGQHLASTFTNLTETQLKQIEYLRDNTKNFIQSIEKFALNLNDIMKLLRKDNKQRISSRTLRCVKKYQNESIKNSTVSEKIEKLKYLLIKYNLVQNKFMKGMFDVLVTLDQKTKPDFKKLAKVSDETEKYNESLVIDNYTKNIINNLRKLKSLAEKLSFKSRMKRAAKRDDDAIDYFLVLIEYLLKQNRPLDVPPVSDGIDILIEAIQNAPDLKFKQNIDLFSVPLPVTKTDTITTETFLVRPYQSKNKINENNITLEANKIIEVFESLDEESKGTNMYDHTDKYYERTDSKYKNKMSDEKSTINNLDSTTLIPRVYIARDDDEKINSILGRFDIDKNDDKRGYEVFVDDTDEDDIVIVTSTQSSEVDREVDIPVTQNTPKRTTFPPDADENVPNNSLNSLKAIKNTNLEWAEENSSHEENRRDALDPKETTTQIATLRATRTIKKTARRYDNPVSSISGEIEDEKQGKTMNPEYVMYKKQMNLLNSLDYGTEKSVLDSDSKEEKYNSDSFPFM